MLVEEAFRKCVVFLMADLRDPETGLVARTPIATALVVGLSLGIADKVMPYLVTCKHVIDNSRPGELYVALNPKDGSPVQARRAPQDSWTVHPLTDVAVLPIGGESFERYDLLMLSTTDFVTDEFLAKYQVGFGDEVFFVGLFKRYPGPTRSEPIVRFGNISLLPRSPVPVKMGPSSDAPTIQVDAYLVEARSWGGQSGSPAFVYFTLARRTPSGGSSGQFLMWQEPGYPSPRLLGLVHGHYDIEQEVAFTGDILGGGKVPLNAGIAVVVPAQKIIETLMDERLVSERTALQERIRKSL